MNGSKAPHTCPEDGLKCEIGLHGRNGQGGVNDKDDGMFKAGGGRISGDRCILDQEYTID